MSRKSVHPYSLSQVPTVRLSAMSEAKIRAYVIADNKLAENAGWDHNLLGLEFQYLSSLDIDFDVGLTGFELPEIDLFIGELDAANSNELADAPIPLPVGPAVTRLGDIWQIGNHRLICGDSTERDTYQQLLGEARALVFTDPPYNVPIVGHVGGLGSVQHREFAMASSEMSQSEFIAFLTSIFTHLAEFSVDSSIHFQCMDRRLAGRHQGRHWVTSAVEASMDRSPVCVWQPT
jgi:hypothetical protein